MLIESAYIDSRMMPSELILQKLKEEKMLEVYNEDKPSI